MYLLKPGWCTQRLLPCTYRVPTAYICIRHDGLWFCSETSTTLHNCKRVAHSTEDTFEAESNTCCLGAESQRSHHPVVLDFHRLPVSWFCLLLSRCFLPGLHKDTQWLSPWRTKWFEPADLTWVHTSSIRNVAHNNDYCIMIWGNIRNNIQCLRISASRALTYCTSQ